ncbi:hypothetical protein RIF29_07596 [Crotalaria pallida]|uniref:Uncharacterized protein n=1 Tax=Crotalaria pallida TaxID=3830 RepID=A0AAN9PC60_CROPI
MAAYEGRPLVMEMEQEELDFDGLEESTSSSGCGCGFFRVFSLKWWQGHDEDEGKRLLEQRDEGWVMNKLKKVKETSEVIAGPKWKTLIRKISSGYGKKKQKKRFQYDEQSYALNFNSGAQSEDEDYIRPTFSSRFSAPLPAGATSARQNEL